MYVEEEKGTGDDAGNIAEDNSSRKLGAFDTEEPVLYHVLGNNESQINSNQCTTPSPAE